MMIVFGTLSLAEGYFLTKICYMVFVIRILCNVAYLSNGDLEIMNADWFKNTITPKGDGDDAFRLSSSSGNRYPLEKINMI